MKLTKEETQVIQILRLVKKVSHKHGEGYYSITSTPDSLNKHYYFPKRSHCKFDTPEETISSLKNLLAMDTLEYRYDLAKMLTEINRLEGDKRRVTAQLKVLKDGYKTAISKLGGVK